jgi:hypothetical protein
MRQLHYPGRRLRQQPVSASRLQQRYVRHDRALIRAWHASCLLQEA